MIVVPGRGDLVLRVHARLTSTGACGAFAADVTGACGAFAGDVAGLALTLGEEVAGAVLPEAGRGVAFEPPPFERALVDEPGELTSRKIPATTAARTGPAPAISVALSPGFHLFEAATGPP